MAEVFYSETKAQALAGKVVVLTGGAQGIGAACVHLLHQLGAHVFFGDWDETKGREVETRARASASSGAGSAHFLRVDVRDYQSQLALFESAYQKHGRLDVGISCAAVKEPGGWFEPENLTLESVRQEPLPVQAAIDINLTSVLSFARLALAYMNQPSPGSTPTTTTTTTTTTAAAAAAAAGAATTPNPSPFPSPSSSPSKSLVLVSSIAGLTEAPGLPAYSAAKHGVVGLSRSLARRVPASHPGGVRANAVCPWATDTQLLGGVRARWAAAGMPLNTPGDVARLIVLCAADGALNGRSVFVSGGRGFDVEEGLDRCLPVWMGEENARLFRRGQEILGLGEEWTGPGMAKL